MLKTHHRLSQNLIAHRRGEYANLLQYTLLEQTDIWKIDIQIVSGLEIRNREFDPLLSSLREQGIPGTKLSTFSSCMLGNL